MKQGKSRFGVWLCAAFMAVLMLTAAMGLVACNGAKDLRIDVPDRIEEDLGTGTYVVPRYDVVNKNGMIMAGYSVRLKSVTDPNGDAVEPVQEASTVVPLSGAGEYTFVYTADSKNVADATVIMDFADRTAPTIQLSSSQFPSFFIKGNTYAVPEYTLQGDFSAAKCYTKVFYNDGNGGEDTEISMPDGSFKVEYETGKYTVLIHVEDAVGNANDYRYVRSVYAPAQYDPTIVVYFNEAFGEKQVAPEDNYTGKYVSVADGGKAYGNESGSYKIEFSGNATTNNEAYFAINVPAISNVIGYKELEMYVYVEDDACVNGATQWVVGSKWWNDTAAKTGEWTRVTWSIDNWGNGTGANSGANTSQVISTDNISGTRIRLIPDGAYSNTPAPHGSVYFSAMRLIPWDWVNITAENGVQAPKRVKAGENVALSAPAAPEGKYFDCFLVNGRPISGNTFVAREENTTVTVRYTDTPVSAEHFTWGETDFYTPAGGDAQTAFIANAQHWAIEYDLHGIENNADGSARWCFAGVYVGGNDQLLGFELDGKNDKLSGYGGSWKEMSGVKLTAEQSAALRNATQAAPAKVAYVRSGDKLVVLLNGKFAGVFSFAAFEISGDDFGLGGRNGPVNAVIENIRYTVGEELTGFAQNALGMKATVKTENGAHAEKTEYMLGDTVTLTADSAATGKKFAYYEVNGQKIAGDRFVITESVTVQAVYSEISMITLGTGVALKDGSTGTVEVARGADVELVFTGRSPSGKYFKGFKAGETLLSGNVFVPTENEHTVTAEFADRAANGNEEVNDVSEVNSASDWRSKGDSAPAQAVYVTDRAYDGIDKSVSEAGSLKVTLQGGEQGLALNTAKNVFLSDYESLYFYAYTEASGLQAGAWWCADTALTPGKWTKITVTRSMNLLSLDNAKVWETGVGEFVYRFMGGKEGTVVYVTSLFGVPYADVAVTVADGSKDTLTLSNPVNGKTYKENETVTLTAAPAPTGKAFAYFTVNGEKIVGNTYTLTAQAAEFAAVYTDISALTLGEGITANGESGNTVTVAKGTAVTLDCEAASEQGKVFNCYVLNGTQKLYGNVFVASENTYVISVEWVDANAIVWGDKEEAHDYKTTMSGVGSTLQNYKYVGTVFGTSRYWAIKLDVKHTREWENLDFVVGEKTILRLRYHGGKYFGIGLHVESGGDDTYPSNEFYMAFPHHSAESQAIAQKIIEGTTLTCIRYGNKLSLYADNELIFTTEYAIDYTGNWFGVGYDTESPDNVAADQSVQVPDHKNVRFIMGQDKVDAYIASVKKINVTQHDSLVKYSGNDYEYTLPSAAVTDLTGNTISQTVAVTATGISGTISVTDGKITLPAYNGAQSVTITYASADCIQVSVTVAFQKSGGNVVMEANESGAKTITANGSTITFDDTKQYGADTGSVKITVNTKQGNQDYGYLTLFDWGDNDYIEFYVYTETANMNTGALWYGDTALTQNEWTKVRLNKLNNEGQMSNLNAGRWIIRFVCYDDNVDLANVSFWISSMTLGKNA